MAWKNALAASSAALLICAAGAATAGETVGYGPPPTWVQPVDLPKPDPKASGAVELLLQDAEVDFGADTETYYVETAIRVLSAAGLQAAGQVGTIWDPATQDLTINRLEIIRDGKTIDVLAEGDKFLVLRRENNLSLAVLDGRLTASKQVEDLRVGDIVRFAMTLRGRDPVVQGHSEAFNIWSNELPISRTRLRVLWPTQKAVRWQAAPILGKPDLRKTATGSELILDRKDFTAPEAPAGAPARYALPARVEFSDYADWKTVSAVMAPLYARASVLKVDSPLKAEAAKIKAASNDPMTRTLAALKLVQEQVRYVYLENGLGGYVPANADQTWSRRFGDCKGKTVLVMALLQELGVDATPALVSSNGSDGLDAQLPRAGAFDHVIVRSVIAGRTYWLDGTQLGQGLADISAPPPLDWALPLTTTGAGLERLVLTVPERPLQEVLIEVDASRGLYNEGPVKIEMLWRGPAATAYREQVAAMPKAQMDKGLKEMVTESYDWVTPESFDYGPQSDGAFKISVVGKGKGNWSLDDKTHLATWYVTASSYGVEFDKRTEGVDKDAPYALSFPNSDRFVTRIKLPRGGAGFTVSGDDVDRTIAGIHLRRQSKIDDGWAIVEVTRSHLTKEVAAKDAQAAKDGFDKLASKSRVEIRAPRNLTQTTQEADTLVSQSTDKSVGLLQRAFAREKANQLDAAMADYDESVAADPKAEEPRLYRAALLARLNKTDAALADLDAAIANAPKSTRGYTQKASLLHNLRRDPEAIATLVGAENAGVNDSRLIAQRAWLRWRTADKAAKADIQAALKLNPDDGWLQSMAVLVQLPSDRPPMELNKLAVEGLTPVLNKHPSVDGFVARAESEFQLRRFAEAAADYGRAIELAKDRPGLYGDRALALSRAGDNASALADYERWVRLEPSKDSYFSRADFKFRQKDYAGAEDDYRLASGIDPDDLSLKTNGITMVRLRGDTERANKMWDELIAANPKSAQVYVARARGHLSMKNYDEAITDLQAAEKLASDPPTRSQVTFTLSQTYELMKRYPEAVAAADRGIAAFPGNASLLNNRCWLKATRKIQLETAVADCDAALKLAPDEAAFLDSRALAQLRSGQVQAAIKDYDVALAARPDQASSLYGRSLAKARAGDDKGAAADRAAALKADPKVVEQFAGYGL